MTKTPAATSGRSNASVLLSERLRISEILESLEGRRNPAMAAEFALRTPLDALTAKALLAQAPAANPYLAAMDAQGPIGLTAATADFSPADPKEARRKELAESMKAFNAARGFTPKTGVGY
jgi:hypothetical protein